MNRLLLIPLLLPFFSAIVTLVWWRPSSARRGFVLVSCLLQLFVSLYLLEETTRGAFFAVAVGNWVPPIGISLALDALSAVLITLASLSSLTAVVYGFFETDLEIEHPVRLPMVFFVVTGLQLCFLTGDLFNLFVGFEVMLISSYTLLTMESNDRNIRETLPYLLINLFGSFVFLSVVAAVYLVFGTLNFADIIQRAPLFADDVRMLPIAVGFLIVFGIKAAAFPLHYWLPHTYPNLPGALAALFSGVLTKLGLYALIRCFVTLLPQSFEIVSLSLFWMALPTMVFGVLGAVSFMNVRKILAYHSISQMGYMLFCLSMFTPGALAAGIYFMIHHNIVKSSLFFCTGVIQRLHGTDELSETGGLWKQAPVLGGIFLIQALALAGLPPLSGFWAKYFVIYEGISTKNYLGTVVSLLVSVVTLISMLKIWMKAFWGESPKPPASSPATRGMAGTALFMTALLLTISLGVKPIFRISEIAAKRAFEKNRYQEGVFSLTGKGDVRK